MKQKGILEDAICYLSGPMEFVADHGVLWRRKFIQLSDEADMSLEFIDPTDKPGEDITSREDQEHQKTLQQGGRFFELAEYVRNYRHFDLRSVDYCDFVVAVIDPTIPQWGTANECYMAEDQVKPIFLVCDQGGYTLPRWLFGLVRFDENKQPINIFTSIESVIERLAMIDRGEYPIDKEWILIRKFLRRRNKRLR